MAYDIAEEKKFILDTENWPHYPLLPVKRYVNGHSQIGIMRATDLKTVYLVNIFNDVIDLLTCGKEEYESLDALLIDGWVGD